MNRRTFLKAVVATMLAAPATSMAAPSRIRHARITVYPGAGLAHEPLEDLLAAYRPLMGHLSGKIGRDAGVWVARSVRDTDRPAFRDASYALVPPDTAAKLMLQGGFLPLVRSSAAKGAPGYTLMVASSVSVSERSRMRDAMTGLPPSVVSWLQKGLYAPVPGFVTASVADYKLLTEAAKA